MQEIVVALSTVPADFDARALAGALVEQGVAACVTIVPGAESVYRWEGAIERSQEQQLLIKTTRDRVEALQIALQARHPYTVPEFVVVPVIGGLAAYLGWVAESVT